MVIKCRHPPPQKKKTAAFCCETVELVGDGMYNLIFLFSAIGSETGFGRREMRVSELIAENRTNLLQFRNDF